MSKPESPDTSSAIVDALRAKRERKGGISEDIAAIEAALLADIESFDLDAAERRAKRENLLNTGAPPSDPELAFPPIAPADAKPAVVNTDSSSLDEKTEKVADAPPPAAGSSLLDQLRQEAAACQRAAQTAHTQRTAVNEAIDQALKRLFSFLHELVQQINIVKPEIPRRYALNDELQLGPLAWQEGFADYRTQAQSAGALIESVSCSFHLTAPGALSVERDGPTVERFRGLLFDFGLQFSYKEFKNKRYYVERAEFEIRSEISVNAYWRADYNNGTIVLEARNLERLGSVSYVLRPQALDPALFDEFGRLMLGQPNRFRELAKRQ